MLQWTAITKSLGLGLASFFAVSQTALAASFLVGFQTYENCTLGNNNSGVCETFPQSNSTYDATPEGSIGPDNLYLTAVIGPEASSLGEERKGWGQNTNPGFLNGEGFGQEAGNSERFIVNVPNAEDGSLPGIRYGAYGTALQGAPDGTSSWKFGNSGNQRKGDVRLTNHSDFYFKLTFLNFDARVGNSNSPHELEIAYLDGNGTAFDNDLIRLDTGEELINLKPVYSNDFGAQTGAQNVSRSLGEAVGAQVYLPPQSSAAFRLSWSGQLTELAQSQIDNFAFQGTFYATADLVQEVNPVPEPLGILGGVAALSCVGLLSRRRRAR